MLRTTVALTALLLAAPRGDAGDLLVTNARLPGCSDPASILVVGGRIRALGNPAEVGARAPGGVPVLDAAGGLVLPGFHDSHLHLESGGAAMDGADLADAEDLPALQAILRDHARENPGPGWVLGRGWGYAIAGPGRRPDRHALDAAVPDRPVLLESYDGHAMWANSRALAAIGFDATTPDPEGGTIVREADGRTPSGLLLEAAGARAEAAVPAPPRAVRLDRVRRAAAHLAGLGITTVEDMSYALDAPELYRELAEAGELPLRVRVWLPLGTDLDEVEAARARFPGDPVTVAGMKGFVDGVVESRTALMVDPYPGSADRGHTARDAAWLRDHVIAAARRGVPLALHCVGDGAVRLALDWIQEARRAGAPRARHRIEHIEALHPADVFRFRALGVAASMQPYHAVPSSNPGTGPWASNMGPRRLAHAFPWRSIASAGGRLAFGSDWPVMSADPLKGLAVASTRRNASGLPEGGWYPAEVLPLPAALRAYAFGSAWAAGRERDLGRLAPGAAGDLVVIAPGVDPAVPATLWDGDRVVATVLGGRVTYKGPDPAP